ncbi:MAG: STM4015 family protein [Acidobacteriota bacterium]
MINEHIRDFMGKKIVEFESGISIEKPESTAYRVSLTYEETEDGVLWADKFSSLLNIAGSDEIRALVIGPWADVASGDTSDAVIETLVSARARLPKLTMIFFGDIIGEESEISWIRQGDFAPLLAAYPALTHLVVRGGDNLSFGSLRHDHLQSLTIQTGGLGAQVVREIANAQLPALEHLELWLGTRNYGGNTTVEDLKPILNGTKFPKLKYLGLRDSDIADEVAKAVAQAPILNRIKILDLSLGTLTDQGAQALIESPGVAKLEFLDLHHHYCSEETVEKLNARALKVDTSDLRKAETYHGDNEIYRYVAVSE